jgi:hypothetical protein
MPPNGVVVMGRAQVNSEDHDSDDPETAPVIERD